MTDRKLSAIVNQNKSGILWRLLCSKGQMITSLITLISNSILPRQVGRHLGKKMLCDWPIGQKACRIASTEPITYQYQHMVGVGRKYDWQVSRAEYTTPSVQVLVIMMQQWSFHSTLKTGDLCDMTLLLLRQTKWWFDFLTLEFQKHWFLVARSWQVNTHIKEYNIL